MTEREFCYWLQGLFEVGKPETLNAEQTEMIRKHLALVFTNVTKLDLSKPVAEIDGSKIPPAGAGRIVSIPTMFPVPGSASDVHRSADWRSLCQAAQANAKPDTATIRC